VSSPRTTPGAEPRRNEAWRAILDIALDAVIVMDTSGNVVDWSACAQEIFGWARAETIGRSMAELIVPPGLRAAHAAGLARFLATGTERVIGRRIEITGLRRSGEEFPLELSISALPDPSGLLFFGFIRDLTQVKRVETTLRESEERFSRAFNASAHPMTISTLAEGRLVDINAAGLAATGRTREEVIGRTIRDLGFYDDPESARRVRDILRQHGQFKDLEMTFQRKSGPRVYLLSGALVELRGEPCVLLSAVDITGRKRSEEKIRLLMREMNHRANNLLSVVIALVQQTGAAYGDVRVSDRIAERIKGLTASNSLLISGEWRGAEIGELIRTQIGPFADTAARVRTKGPSLRLNATAVQSIGMALHELSTNAIKYGALASPHGSIEIEWGVDGGSGQEAFFLTWREQGGPPVDPPQRSGFGRTVIEQMASHAVNGRSELTFDRCGLVWALRCAAKEALET
jgi:PAS domain S-box-containing protein